MNRKMSAGFTLLELQLVVVVIGILAMVLIPRVLSAGDRARVAAAVYEVEHFRKALSIYEVDHGRFPQADRNDLNRLVGDLVDLVGDPYMTLPDGENFQDFRYHSWGGGQEYWIEVVANDAHQTLIHLDPDGVHTLQ